MSFTSEGEKQQYYINKCKEIIKAKEAALGRKLTACVCTFGCQMNFKDSEKLLGILTEIGYEETEDEHADLVLYNTCTVRENANLKIYGRLGYLSKIKEKNPDMIIGLCGCMMQEPQVVEKLNKSYKFIDLIFGTHNVFLLAELLYERLISGHKIQDIWDGTTEIVEDLPAVRKYDFKSGVNIMYGCDNFCSYCIVPYVRGRERSRNPEDIINEIKDLVANGVVEIMLLGQNVNSYGKNLENPITFAQLLEQVEKIDGLKRIRFMTSHPKDLSDELIEVMAKSKKICKQMHLPLQSGSTALLQKMNRHYTKEQYLELVRKLREAIPDIGISTDIIVGFPGETEEQFNELYEFVKKVRFDRMGAFTYSQEEDTPAADFPNQVDEEIKEERLDRLMTLQQGISLELNKAKLGKTLEVLVEGYDEESFLFYGRSRGDSIDVDGKVYFATEEEVTPGDIIKVKILDADEYDLTGQAEVI